MTKYNIPDITKGNTFVGVKFQMKIDGVASSLAGYSLQTYFRKGGSRGDVVKKIKNGSGISITDSAAGKFEFDAFIVDWEPGKYYYDVLFEKNGVLATYVSGTWNVLENITNHE